MDLTIKLMKICIIGSTSLKTRMVQSLSCRSGIDPTGPININSKEITIDDQVIRLILADGGGQSFFSKKNILLLKQSWGLKPTFYRGASACIITFDKRVKASLEAVSDWYKEFKKNIGDSRIPIALVGLTNNTEEIISIEGQKIAKKLGVSYYETSSTNQETITPIFRELTVIAVKKGILRYKIP